MEFAIVHEAVAGLFPNPSILPLPPSPSGVAGILPHAVSPRYVLDLHQVFGMGRAVARCTAIALHRYPAALLVDSILDSVWIGESSLKPVRAMPRHTYRKYTNGVWRGRSRPCFLLDLGKLLEPAATIFSRSPGADLLVPHSAPRLP
ncbi:MAG: chemotaxis protein CheW [Bryobacterales bacterium]|nr:chemotaxis protein CheW [Bryobacterales bacterium]